jgi:hypothetical protein
VENEAKLKLRHCSSLPPAPREHSWEGHVEDDRIAKKPGRWKKE